MRLNLIKAIIAVVFMLLVIGLGFIQVLKGGYYFDLSRRNYVRLLPQEGLRGNILDVNGNVLADNYLSLNVSVVPQEMVDKDSLFKNISNLLDLDESILNEAYKKGYLSPFLPVVIVPDISQKQATVILEKRSYLPGVFIQHISRRSYPYKKACAHVLGYVDDIDRERFSKLKKYGYNFKDKIGYGGIEEYFDSYLRGENGGKQIQVDNLGKQVKLLGIKKPTKGKDMTLTIDIRMQKIAYQVLAERRGAVVIMNPQTGSILAMASSPSFDPEIFIRSDAEEISKLQNDKYSPSWNRAISGQYPLGSIFKLVLAIAALDSGKTNKSTTYFCNGTFKLGGAVFNCWSRHNSQDLREAIIHSCNVYFYNLGKTLGIDLIYGYAKLFALGEFTGIELPGESKGFVPSAEWKQKMFNSKWYAGDTINLSIGQGQLLATPLQATLLMAALVNGGYLVKPYLADNIDDVDVSKNSAINLGLKKSDLDFLKDSMLAVVKEPKGTGHYAYVSKLTIGAKTGTAQARRGAHGWIVGFAPADNPQIVFVVILEHIGSSAYAAKVAQKMLNAFVQQEILN